MTLNKQTHQRRQIVERHVRGSVPLLRQLRAVNTQS